MDQFYEEVQEPVSPPGQYFNSSVICSYVFGFLEIAVPIDDSETMHLLKDVFLPINPRLSSIMVLPLFHVLLYLFSSSESSPLSNLITTKLTYNFLGVDSKVF